MLKLVYCLTKRADVDSAEFHRYWLNDHGPLVKGYAEAIGAVKYIQSHTVAPDLNAIFVESRGLEPAYDGITEVWWDSKKSLESGMASEAGQAAHAALKEDESKFIDFSKSRVFMTEEHVIFDN
ncbi:MAG: EthD domain-containing protein [Gammaproteobacteria bacterium]